MVPKIPHYHHYKQLLCIKASVEIQTRQMYFVSWVLRCSHHYLFVIYRFPALFELGEDLL